MSLMGEQLLYNSMNSGNRTSSVKLMGIKTILIDYGVQYPNDYELVFDMILDAVLGTWPLTNGVINLMGEIVHVIGKPIPMSHFHKIRFHPIAHSVKQNPTLFACADVMTDEIINESLRIGTEVGTILRGIRASPFTELTDEYQKRIEYIHGRNILLGKYND